MSKSTQKKNRVRRWLRRLFKIGLWTAGVFLLLFISAVIFVRVQYPESRVLQLISENVKTNTGMSLQIEDIAWQLPLRLVVSQITLGYPSDSIQVDDAPLISLNRFSVSFRLLPLLKRRLHVQSVALDQPKVFLDPDQLMLIQSKDSKRPDSNASSDSSTQSSAVLPLALGLSRLHLNDFDCMVILPDTQTIRFFQITGLNFKINHLHVPRDVATSLEDVRGQVHLYTDDAALQYSEDGFGMLSRPELNLKATWGRNQHWQAQGLVGIASILDSSQQIKMQVDLQGIGKGDSILINPFRMDVGKRSALMVKGSLKNLIEQPEFRATLESATIDLNEIQSLARSFLPPAMSTVLESFKVNGDFILPQGEVWGNSNNVHFRLTSSLRNGYLDMPIMNADSLFYDLEIQGSMEAGSEPEEPMKFGEGLIQGEVGLSGFHASLNDSTTTQTGPLFIQFESRMDSSGLPQEGSLTGQLTELLGGQLGLNFKWGLLSDAPKIPESIFVNGSIYADSIDISEIPNVPPIVQGSVNLKADLAMPNLYQAVVDIGADVPRLSYALENLEDQLPPLQLSSSWAIQTDPTFQQVWLDSGHIQLNNLFQAHFKGQTDIQKQAFWMELKEATLDHEQVQFYLPPTILETMDGMALDGQTAVIATVKGLMAQPDSMQIKSLVAIKDGAFHHEYQNLNATGIMAEISATGTPQQLKGNGSLSLENLDLGPMRTRPIENSVIMFDWQWIADESVSLTEGMLRNDSLNLNVQFDAGIENLGIEPTMHVLGEINFDKDDWVEAVQEMMIRGHSKIQFQVDQASDPSRLAISGKAMLRPLAVAQEDVFAISELRGLVPFQIEMDLEKAIIVTDPDYKPPSWIDYESRRSQFRSLNPDQGTLSAKSIDVAGYQFTDLIMDIDIRKGYVQAPWFMVNTFDGNAGGYLQVFLGTGQPETIAYEVHAQASRINAAALGNIPIKKKEEAELNVTMAFSGLGVDIEKEMEMNGYFYITQIGPQFASLLLKGMDPNGEDRNIRLTRRLLLNMGWKPKLFSFEMRHGYVYPSLSLSQPWFSPIRLPETLSFGRLPLKFFLENPELAQAK